MSQSDDPFAKPAKTVIRPRPGGPAQTPGQERTVIRHAPITPPGQALDTNPWGAPPQPPATGLPGGAWPSHATPPAPPHQPPFAPFGAPGNPAAFGGSGHDWVSQRSPEFPGMAQPQPAQPRRRMPLAAAIQMLAKGEVKATNPITQAAVPLLILLGRLRQLVVEMDAMPLMQHVSRSIGDFERTLLGRAIDPEQVQIAKYALCATADDIVQNLPEGDKNVWLQYSMLAQYFNVRTSGTVLFDKIRALTANPTLHYDLLELIHACLSLGFQGQYRAMAGGDIELQRVRRDVFQTLRAVRPRTDDGISPRWMGVDTGRGRLADGIPVWTVAAAAAGLLAAGFMTLRVLLGADGDALSERMVLLHPQGPVLLARADFAPLPEPAYVQDTTQLDRIRAALAPEIQAGSVTAAAVGETIVIGVSNVLLFDSGSADVKADFEPLARRIADALDKEPGPINIVGHTDNVKLRATSRFKSNHDLSVARAEGVAALITTLVSDPSRISIAGRGELDPVAANDTAEGRARNRRVDLSIPREETL
ncbi:MAG: type VI secretion system protein TssL, long form [Rhizobiaceae bacterium]|jgi:type VI secretion system protein ImpK|nr:type VI secretion system protein TssL, long form [Rhizobiaceae bacterium]